MMAEGVDTPTAILANAAAALRENPFDDISYRSLGDALALRDSAATWVTFRREFAMTRSDIGDAAAWAAEAVLDPIRSRVG